MFFIKKKNSIHAINSNITTLKNQFFIIQEYKFTIDNFGATNNGGDGNSSYSLKITPTIPSGYTTASYCLAQSWDFGFVSTIVPPEYNDASGGNRYIILIKHNYMVNNHSSFQFTFRIVFTKSDMTSITTSTGTVKK